jgi:hypothetical protein
MIAKGPCDYCTGINLFCCIFILKLPLTATLLLSNTLNIIIILCLSE